MLKLFGAVLVLGACIALGMTARERVLRRLHAIDAMLTAIDFIASEVECRLTPLPAIIETLAVSDNCLVAELFGLLQRKLHEENGQSLPYKWCRAMREARGDIGLGEEEAAVLCDMAGFLGRYDAEQQVKSLTHIRARLSEIRTRVQEETRVRGNLYRSCGAAIGVMTVLILL